MAVGVRNGISIRSGQMRVSSSGRRADALVVRRAVRSSAACRGTASDSRPGDRDFREAPGAPKSAGVAAVYARRMAGAEHWDERYGTVGSTELSWFEAEPAVSLELIDSLGVDSNQSVIDVGGGASLLIDRLLGRGHDDLAVLDISALALAEARRRTGDPAAVEWIEADLATWEPPRRWDVWHDRAVAHFLTTDGQRAAYARALSGALGPDGAFVIGAFAPDGPTHCSGLEVRRQSFDDLADLVGDALITERRHHIHRTPSGGEQSFNWIAGRCNSA